MPRPHRPKPRLALLATATLLLLFSICTWVFGYFPQTPACGLYYTSDQRKEVRAFGFTAYAGRLYFIRQSGKFVTSESLPPRLQREMSIVNSFYVLRGSGPDWGSPAFQVLLKLKLQDGTILPGMSVSTGSFAAVSFRGFHASARDQGVKFESFSIHAAYGIALSALLFAWLYLPRLRRPPPHACPHCHYDLRATPNPLGPLLPTCPECGHATHPQNSPPLSDTLSP